MGEKNNYLEKEKSRIMEVCLIEKSEEIQRKAESKREGKKPYELIELHQLKPIKTK